MMTEIYCSWHCNFREKNTEIKGELKDDKDLPSFQKNSASKQLHCDDLPKPTKQTKVLSVSTSTYLT